jgi:chemotaxis protein histidine kinase CheA
MLYKNLLLIVFFIGMALASPINDKEEKKSEVSATVSLVPLETVPATKNDDDDEDNNVEVIQFQRIVDDDEAGDEVNEDENVEEKEAEIEEVKEVEAEDDEKEEEKEAEAEDVEETKDDEKEEEKEAETEDVEETKDDEKEEEKEAEAEDVEETKDDEKEEEKEAETEDVEVKDDEKEEENEEENEVVTTIGENEEDNDEEENKTEIKKIEGVKSDAPENETIIVPEIQEYPMEEKKANTCTRDLLMMGNNYATIDACDDIYNACTTKELLSIILIFYSQTTPVSIEYTIYDDMNKGHISEQCGSVLLNSKIFIDETTVIQPIDEIASVEKITTINQDLPKVSSAVSAVIADDKKESSDPFAFDGEDPIEDDSISK